jgi:predicted nuclease of predicted toxin-antitoxin system
MRILFDENLNWRLRHALKGHEIATVQSLGWTGIKNGQLLRKAVEARFDVLLTRDNNLVYQQDLSTFPIAVIVLRVRSNLLEDGLALMPKVLQILPSAPRGQRTIVSP